MKKIICLFLVFLGLHVQVDAQKVGAVYATDIYAYIDGLMIPSYNIDGYTSVLVRDLENYGFSVIWDPNAKKVNLQRDPTKEYKPIIPTVETRAVGTKVFDLYKTDIRTFFQGKEIRSYNIGGKTAVRLKDIATVGSAVFNPKYKSADILCKDIEFFDSEIKYIKKYFYGNLLLLAKGDIAIYNLFSMLESGSYNLNAVENYKTFQNELKSTMDAFRTYQEPYGFSDSAQELWWAMVNMRYAGETALIMSDVLKNGGNPMTSKYDYTQYRTDCLEQRRIALRVLDEEIQALNFFWN